MSEAYNGISQGLKEAIEYSRKDKVEVRLTEGYSLIKPIKTE